MKHDKPEDLPASPTIAAMVRRLSRAAAMPQKSESALRRAAQKQKQKVSIHRQDEEQS